MTAWQRVLLPMPNPLITNRQSLDTNFARSHFDQGVM
jgi:hypothetical protein